MRARGDGGERRAGAVEVRRVVSECACVCMRGWGFGRAACQAGCGGAEEERAWVEARAALHWGLSAVCRGPVRPAAAMLHDEGGEDAQVPVGQRRGWWCFGGWSGDGTGKGVEREGTG
eukprot:223429-Pleurochrysis_carterae.AAC.1